MAEKSFKHSSMGLNSTANEHEIFEVHGQSVKTNNRHNWIRNTEYGMIELCSIFYAGKNDIVFNCTPRF